MSHPSAAKSIAELRSLSDEELIRQHDSLAQTTGVGISYYLEELHRRRIDRQNRRMEVLTVIIGILTLINVVVVLAG